MEKTLEYIDAEALIKNLDISGSRSWGISHFMNLRQYRHMPPDWKQNREDEENCLIFLGTYMHGDLIATTASSNRPLKERKANAQLISYSLKMLTSLIDQINMCEELIDYFHDLRLHDRAKTYATNRNRLIAVVEGATEKSWSDLRRIANGENL